jgi:hypothetical protein
MSRSDVDALVVLWKGIALGFGFVWLFGFAVGYPNAWIPLIIAGASLGSLIYSFVIYAKNNSL